VTQQNNESLSAFYKRWINTRDVTELHWGPMYPNKLVTFKTVESETEATDEAEAMVSEHVQDNSAEVRNKFQASLYLASVNMSKHGKVIDKLQHQYRNKQDNYPNNPEDAMTMLSYRQDTTHRKKFHKEKEKSTPDELEKTNFAQQPQSISTKKKSKTKDDDNSSTSSKQSIPKASLSAGTVNTVLLHWKLQECVGDRVKPLSSY
jgi:hypothetical protein